MVVPVERSAIKEEDDIMKTGIQASFTEGHDVFVPCLTMVDNEHSANGPYCGVRFALIDRTGPLAEFGTWEAAYEYMATHRVQGGSIVRIEESLGARIEPTNHAEERPLWHAAKASGQPGWPAMSYEAVLEGLMPAPLQPPATLKKKVLVIEPDVFALLTITQMVKSAGHDVTIARDAAEGIEVNRSEDADLILVGINLTASAAEDAWESFQVLEWLKSHHTRGKAKYIIISAGDPEKLKPRAAAVGASGLLGKPIVKELLLAEITRAIGAPPEPKRSEAPQPGPA